MVGNHLAVFNEEISFIVKLRFARAGVSVSEVFVAFQPPIDRLSRWHVVLSAYFQQAFTLDLSQICRATPAL
jgi:hypothetical protein